jgi:hypothetical protein
MYNNNQNEGSHHEMKLIDISFGLNMNLSSDKENTSNCVIFLPWPIATYLLWLQS